MSSHLVKRLLRATELPDKEQEARSQKKRRLPRSTATQPVASQEEIVASHVRTMLYMDGAAGATGRSKAGRSRKKKTPASSAVLAQRERRIAPANARPTSAIVTNARSAALQATAPILPTYNRQAHQRQKETKALARLARRLQGASASMKKVSKT